MFLNNKNQIDFDVLFKWMKLQEQVNKDMLVWMKKVEESLTELAGKVDNK